MRSGFLKAALLLAAVLGTTTLATTADAYPWHRGHHWRGHHWRGGYAVRHFYRPAYRAYAYGDCYMKRRVHYTPWGPVVRRARVCY